VGARFASPVQTHPDSCTMGTGSFPGVKSDRGVTLTPHHLLVSWSRKNRAIPLLPLGAVRPVQILSACTRVHTLTVEQCCRPVIPNLGYAYPQRYEPGHLRVRGGEKKRIMAEKGTYVNSVRQDTSRTLLNSLTILI